ncbi:hypothetical protein D3C72_2601270 [compost metagenome]
MRGRLEARIDEADIEVNLIGQRHHREPAVLCNELVDHADAHALLDQRHSLVGIGERQQ